MPRDEVEITNKVMDKIRSGEVKMHSRWYFVLGSIAMILGLASSVVLAAFFVSLTSFALRTHGPMGSYRFQEILASFPWWAPLLAVAGLGLGIWFLRKFDFTHKRSFLPILIVLLLAVILAGVTIDYLGLNDVWMKRGPMRQYWEQMGQGQGRQGQGAGQGSGQGRGMMRDNN
jgi:uncharacterized membrane protein